MCFWKKFAVIKLLFILLTNQPEAVKCIESLLPEIETIFIDEGESYVPSIVQEQLETVLEASIGLDKNLTEDEKYYCHSVWRQFDEETDRIGIIVDQQAKNVKEKLKEAKKNRILEITKKMFDSIVRLRSYYKDYFLKCLVEKKCTTFRNLYTGELKKDFDNFIKNLRSNKNVNELHIFDVILIASEVTDGDSPQWCGSESVQNTIYNLHKYIRGVVIQMYRMILYFGQEEYLEAKENGWKNSIEILDEMNEHREVFKKSLIELSKKVQLSLSRASRDILASDPNVHKRGVTYTRLSRFVSAALIKSEFVVYEKLSDNWYYDRRSCGAEMNPDHHQNPYEPWRNGNLRNCTKFFPIVHSIWINETDHERIYHHWDATNTKGERLVYGKYSGDNQGLAQYSFRDQRSFTVRLFTEPKNEFDLCWMDYPITDDYSIRKFSNLPVKASPNNVVTGIRWTVRDQIVYLQIQEGKLIRGAIDPTTVMWKKVITEPGSYVVLDIDRRAFNLDDIILPEGWFVTGVQFELTFDEKAISLGVFQGRANSTGYIDYLDGQIVFPKEYSSLSRQEIMLDEPDVSENAPTNIQHRIVGEPGKHYVRFQPADLKKDGGQTTVPYLDIQSIVTNPPAPISGIGTYYKEMTGYGGFVGLKLISADIISLIKNEPINKIFKEVKLRSKALNMITYP